MKSDMYEVLTKIYNENNYTITNPSDKQILFYKNIFKTFKKENSESNSTIKLNLDNNTIELNNFTGLDMYKFGYLVAKSE